MCHKYKKLYDMVASLNMGQKKEENWHEQVPDGMTENNATKIFRKYNIKYDNVKEDQMLY